MLKVTLGFGMLTFSCAKSDSLGWMLLLNRLEAPSTKLIIKAEI